MLSGLQLMDSVDERLQRAEAEAAAAQADLDWLTARRDQARSAEAAALRTLATFRLGALRSGNGDLQRLDEADAKAQSLLNQQQRLVAEAQTEVASRQKLLQSARAERDRHAAALRKMEADAEGALVAARDTVLADPEWQQKQTGAEAAQRIAEHAEQKAAFALQDQETKGKPYLADPLFAYLWQRGFGTPRYRAFAVVRWVDGWVARVARFEPARRDYAILTALPNQLADHAARMREAAGSLSDEVGEHARQIAGVPPTREMAMLRESLHSAEGKLEAAQVSVDQAAAKRAGLAAGDDPLTLAAMAALEAALGQSSFAVLREAASRTPTLEDDAVVTELEQAGAARAEAERLLAQRRAEVQGAQGQVLQLRQTRQEMRQRGFGQDRWNFGDGAMVGLLLSELLRGTLSRGGFLDRVSQQRVPDPWNVNPGGETSRSSPWGQPPMSNPWGQPGTNGPGGSFGGGGFRTGGSVGGGGFRTGGGF